MERTLSALAADHRLQLQVVATGMHLDRARGYSLREIRRAGFRVDATVPWPATEKRSSPSSIAETTGTATASLARLFQRLKTDIVLVVGDRVEPLAGAVAGHISGLCVAHVHGGDRAPGVVDDSLRHAITKLAHLHFPATKLSASRILRMGEDAWRVRCVGSPGIEGITQDAASLKEVTAVIGPLQARRFALVSYHPAGGDDASEFACTQLIQQALAKSAVDRAIFVYPNNDPGSAGIVRALETSSHNSRFVICRNLSRPMYLGLLRHAAMLVGNSSSGIIEAASFGTSVLDIGPRQHGRERGENVRSVGDVDASAIARAIAKVWNDGTPVRFPQRNLYGSGPTSRRIANTLATVQLDTRLLRKLIAYE